MFEDLFTYGYAIERYRAAPLLDERLRWLEPDFRYSTEKKC